jgi:hypothetical protein
MVREFLGSKFFFIKKLDQLLFWGEENFQNMA